MITAWLSVGFVIKLEFYVNNLCVGGVSGNLVGSYHVRAIRPALDDAKRLMRGARNNAELCRHALKLRWWPDALTTEPTGLVVDLDWA